MAGSVRLFYALKVGHTPIGDKLLIDSAYYHENALRLIEAGWIGDKVFFMNPFYPYFMAGIYTFLGRDWQSIWLIQSAMGTLVCYFTYALGMQLWNKKIGLISAVIISLYGVLIFYEGALLTATPILFFNTSALYLLYARKKQTLSAVWAAGMLLGLSATARPFSLLYATVMVWMFYREGHSAFLKKSALLWSGIFLMLIPVILRNYAIGGEWGLTTSSAGMNFYVGNHPQATGVYTQVDFLYSAEPERERVDFIREAERRCQCDLTVGEASSFWLVQGISYITESPADYLYLILRKTYMFVNQVESQNNLSFYFARDFLPILNWTFIGWWFVFPMGIAGWFSLPKTSKFSPLFLYCLCYWVGCMMFFVSSEYRLPIVPILALYSAYFLQSIWDAYRRGQFRSKRLNLIVLLLISIPVLYKDSLAEKLTMRRVDYYNFAALYERENELEKSAGLYRKSLEIDPYFQPARMGLERIKKAQLPTVDQIEKAQDAFRNEDYLAAIGYFKEAIEGGNNAPETFNNLGLSLYRIGKVGAAEGAFSKALERRIDYDKAAYNMSLVKRAQGQIEQARYFINRAIKANPLYRQALYRRGEWARQDGDLYGAIRDWRGLLELVGPDRILQAKIDSLQEAMP